MRFRLVPKPITLEDLELPKRGLAVKIILRSPPGWKSWKLIARTIISPTPLLFAAQRPSRSRFLRLVFFECVFWLNDTYSKNVWTDKIIETCLLHAGTTLALYTDRETYNAHRYRQTDGQTDDTDDANSRSYCVAVRSAKGGAEASLSNKYFDSARKQNRAPNLTKSHPIDELKLQTVYTVKPCPHSATRL